MNKLIFCLIFLVLGTFLVACNKEKEKMNQNDCIDRVLSDGGYTLYEGQEFDCCNGYLQHYELDEKQYFVYDDCCSDFAYYITMDCDGQSACTDLEDGPCWEYFSEQASYIGIIGFLE